MTKTTLVSLVAALTVLVNLCFAYFQIPGTVSCSVISAVERAAQIATTTD